LLHLGRQNDAMDTDKQAPKPMFTGKKNEGRLKNAVLILAIAFVGLLPIHAYYFVFTKSTPTWLQWLIIALMCVLALGAIVSLVLSWRTSHKALRWLDLLSFTLLLCGLLGFMFFTSLPFSEKWGYSLSLYAGPALISKFLSSKINKHKAAHTE